MKSKLMLLKKVAKNHSECPLLFCGLCGKCSANKEKEVLIFFTSNKIRLFIKYFMTQAIARRALLAPLGTWLAQRHVYVVCQVEVVAR